MDVAPKGVVLEFGAGEGALVSEACKFWKSAKFVTVDIDKNASSFQLPGKTSFKHHVADALDPNLPEKIGLATGTVHSALCNPPYIKPKWRKHFGQILEEAGLSGVYPQISSIPADILFVAQNLRFLRPGGKLGLILPDGIIAGEKCSALRKALSTAHHLERVIELPRRVFSGTDAKAYVVVLTKHGHSSDEIELQRLETDGSLTKKLNLDVERAGDRLDYSFHESRIPRSNSGNSRLQLRDIVEYVGRGTVSSKEREFCDFPVFHTTDFDSQSSSIPRSFQLSRTRANQIRGVIAHPGDILVARVGRNLEDKVMFVENGHIPLSDCVLCIRVAAKYQKQVLSYLRSSAGRDSLRAASHGVSAKFITVDALLNIKVLG
jgi:type I restriction enzyme M protein